MKREESRGQREKTARWKKGPGSDSNQRTAPQSLRFRRLEKAGIDWGQAQVK